VLLNKNRCYSYYNKHFKIYIYYKINLYFFVQVKELTEKTAKYKKEAKKLIEEKEKLGQEKYI